MKILVQSFFFFLNKSIRATFHTKLNVGLWSPLSLTIFEKGGHSLILKWCWNGNTKNTAETRKPCSLASRAPGYEKRNEHWTWINQYSSSKEKVLGFNVEIAYTVIKVKSKSFGTLNSNLKFLPCWCNIILHFIVLSWLYSHLNIDNWSFKLCQTKCILHFCFMINLLLAT